jgi:hypothetical protein
LSILQPVALQMNDVLSRVFRVTPRLTGLAALALSTSCSGLFSGDDAGSAASIRIDTRTPSTLADSDMVVMRASVLDSAGNVLPHARVAWKSLSRPIDVSDDGHLHGHLGGSDLCCAFGGVLGREAQIVATVASHPQIADTTTAYVMLYANFVRIAPRGALDNSFANVASLAVGQSVALHATGFVLTQIRDYRFPPSYDAAPVDQTVYWISRTPEVATINFNGVVTANSVGVATIVVKSRGFFVTDSATVTVH